MRKAITRIKIIILVLVTVIITATVIAMALINSNTQIEKLTEIAKAESLTEVPEGYTGIYNSTQLQNMANDFSGKYILMADIDLSGINWEPIGTTEANPFKGTFNGNNHVISNLNIESSEQFVGLFGKTKNANIQYLYLENVHVNSTFTDSSKTTHVGSIVGHATYGTISNIYVTGNNIVEATGTKTVASIGGVMGGHEGGSKENLEFEGELKHDVDNRAVIGGVVGSISDGSIAKAYANVKIIKADTTVTSLSNIGGILGECGYPCAESISECYANVDMEVTKANAGGIVGNMKCRYVRNGYTLITRSWSTGKIKILPKKNNISSTSYIGGIIGYSAAYEYETGWYQYNHVSNSYSIVNISSEENDMGNVYVGGIAGGYVGPKVDRVYYAGKIDVSSQNTYKSAFIRKIFSTTKQWKRRNKHI